MIMKTWLASLATVILLAGLTGCGGDDPEPQTDAPPTAADPDTPDAPETSAPPTEPAETAEATEPAETTEPAEPAEQVVITIQDFEYTDPGPVPAGAEIMVENQDEAAHTVTAEGDGGFDVTIEGGETATFTAPSEPGDYPFVCTFHPGMTSTLAVE